MEKEHSSLFYHPLEELWNSARKQLKSGLNILSDEDFLEPCNENDHLLADIEKRQFDDNNVNIPIKD